MPQKIIVKHKRTHESLELSFREFKKRFNAELKIALDNFSRMEDRKNFFPSFVKKIAMQNQAFIIVCVGILITYKIPTGI